MEWDILKKEQEYYKENELIESKTKALLQKVDDVMSFQKMQEQLKDTNQKADVPCKRHIASVLSKNEGKDQVISNFSEISLDDPSVPNPSILNDMGQKGMHHFYRTKIKALKEECEKLQIDVRNKVRIKCYYS
ncbi:hypothetical protein HHI36_002550 [Cryptolaemus montrouzieri]|uniref:Uncharacterized protein n=1 Tax=Cryptolaemus montrouzieri TaxID=559131 RepID=A0ABD2PBB7_9CUCU